MATPAGRREGVSNGVSVDTPTLDGVSVNGLSVDTPTALSNMQVRPFASLTNPLTHSLTNPLAHEPFDPLTNPLTHEPLDPKPSTPNLNMELRAACPVHIALLQLLCWFVSIGSCHAVTLTMFGRGHSVTLLVCVTLAPVSTTLLLLSSRVSATWFVSRWRVSAPHCCSRVVV